MTPHVSICLPNLNTLPFLRERFDTILSQTFPDWELFVYDSHSDDGAWELIQQIARQEPRMRIAQGPREGIYPAWNECIRQTKGEFVYLATSDDTMAPDCIEKLVLALERNGTCDLAHCPLHIIDGYGTPLDYPKWPDCTVFAHGIDNLLHQPHIRHAPYDGLLHLTGRMVYTSITQLLIRRSLFSRIGEFSARWGAMGDRNWFMRAGLVANTVHVPDTWASWRIHPAQASSFVNTYTLEYAQKVEDIILDAVAHCQSSLPPEVAAGLHKYLLKASSEMRAYYCGMRHRRSYRLALYRASQLFKGGAAVRAEILGRLRGRSRWIETAPASIRLWLESLHFGPVFGPAR
jgi:glycosyltransferase involved in cell wall biosynthesis